MTQQSSATDSQNHSDKKGKPTPTRKQAQARNARPIVGAVSKEAKEAQRAALAEQRARIREGMANGDERYLPERDKGEQRRFIRDWIDARFSIGELLLPTLFVTVIISFLPIKEAKYGSLVMILLFLLVIVDSIIMNLFLYRRLCQKFGKTRVQRGFRWYAFSRATQMRVMRIPKPRVKHGQWPS
ncbi:DUF3043 domain-containing protein [Canibacter sp. lx-72]|uniref:DUF3043 domain-containing protein n=1 Tax=Canibacter zhuwentaonis TaxID=2837491 RepID=UPI001BDDB06B|nr:DUF3043 domain-containing protein [Canibacter zhuwentaonis]MBT1017856.1 DUF3043 domain-containing protein [Canibacter zhuwentaonis]MBT1035019.1 DUF3043 domain-containing protein [Canibacter zhuwentaonis]